MGWQALTLFPRTRCLRHRICKKALQVQKPRCMINVQGRGEMYDCNPGCGVDPRNIAQRIMEV